TNRQPQSPALSLPEGIVKDVAFSPDSRTLALVFGLGSTRGGVALWNMVDRDGFGLNLGVPEGAIRDVAFSPDKTLAAGYSRDKRGGVVLWDMASRQRLGSPLDVSEGIVEGMAFSPDAKTLA